MNKTNLSRALLAAGVLAVAGVAQAGETFNVPQKAGEASTMTDGRPNLLTTNSPYPDGSHTVIMGSGPAVVTTYPYVTTYSYVLPPAYALPAPVTPQSYMADGWGGATETSNVPLRAGEHSTMTNGVPNLLPNNF